VGDLTFEEAYARSKRILNITVASDRAHEVPKVLNYLTAPNVLIWSAACASTAATYPLYAQVHLLAKDHQGGISKWSPTGRDINWVTSAEPAASIHTKGGIMNYIADGASTNYSRGERESSAHHRLAELFNVNHIIVSQAGALAAPMVLRGWRERHSFWARLVSAALMEVRHRTAQAAYFGLIPGALARWISPDTVSGDITITPELSLSDYRSIFADPNADHLHYWIRKGEVSTWPLISLIQNRCVIELSLDTNYSQMKATSQLIKAGAKKQLLLK
jgi:TAG lipase/lysophosphatidylethanolamine acyltransferase